MRRGKLRTNGLTQSVPAQISAARWRNWERKRPWTRREMRWSKGAMGRIIQRPFIGNIPNGSAITDNPLRKALNQSAKTHSEFPKGGSLKGICKDLFRASKVRARGTLNRSASTDGERFCVQARSGKRRNTLCISRFPDRSMGAKAPALRRRRLVQSFPNQISRRCTWSAFRSSCRR